STSPTRRPAAEPRIICGAAGQPFARPSPRHRDLIALVEAGAPVACAPDASPSARARFLPMTMRPGLLVPLLVLACLAPGAVQAQGLASPFGTVSQRVDSTTIGVEYYRPAVRGRAIFGSLIRWGRLWTPGANWATTLEVNHD